MTPKKPIVIDSIDFDLPPSWAGLKEVNAPSVKTAREQIEFYNSARYTEEEKRQFMVFNTPFVVFVSNITGEIYEVSSFVLFTYGK